MNGHNSLMLVVARRRQHVNGLRTFLRSPTEPADNTANRVLSTVFIAVSAEPERSPKAMLTIADRAHPCKRGLVLVVAETPTRNKAGGSGKAEGRGEPQRDASCLGGLPMAHWPNHRQAGPFRCHQVADDMFEGTHHPRSAACSSRPAVTLRIVVSRSMTALTLLGSIGTVLSATTISSMTTLRTQRVARSI